MNTEQKLQEEWQKGNKRLLWLVILFVVGVSANTGGCISLYYKGPEVLVYILGSIGLGSLYGAIYIWRQNEKAKKRTETLLKLK